MFEECFQSTFARLKPNALPTLELNPTLPRTLLRLENSLTQAYLKRLLLNRTDALNLNLYLNISPLGRPGNIAVSMFGNKS